MSDQSPSDAVTQLLARIDAMQTELASLRAQVPLATAPQLTPAEAVTPLSTRRRMLRRLAGGMLAGLAVGSLAAVGPEDAQARLIVDPPATSGRIGAVVVPRGTPTPGGIPAGTAKYGMVVTDASDASFDMTQLPTQGIGVYSNGKDYGAYAESVSTGIYSTGGSTGLFAKGGFTGVTGYSAGASSTGVFGYSSGTGGTGVVATGVSYGLKGSGAIGVYGSTTAGAGGLAATFQGNVQIVGTLNATTKNFKIDHPLDPANKYLYHTSIESPDMMNIYNGIVQLDQAGGAEVELPVYFEALNTDYRYQLTSLDAASPNLHISQRIKARKFKIDGGVASQEVSWQVSGIRQDPWAKAHRNPVEEDKQGEEKGRYLYPEEHGHGKDKNVDRLVREGKPDQKG